MKPTTIELNVSHGYVGPRGSVASIAELRALGHFLVAISESPQDVQTKLGPFEVTIRVNVCVECYGTGTLPELRTGEPRPQCPVCKGTGRISGDTP